MSNVDTATNKGISIVIPVYNEENNISPMLEGIITAFNGSAIPFEVILVDNNSKDKTYQVASQLAELLPIQVHQNTGKKGTAYSLLYGFKYAKHSYIGTIDSALTHSPQTFTKMVEILNNGADIVVAKRQKNFLSHIPSKLTHTFFAKFLHKLDVDIQSEMKMFRAEILERIKLNSNAKSLDIELLLKAAHAGYVIEEIATVTTKNKKNKKEYFQNTRLAMTAIYLKLKTAEVFPFLQNQQDAEGNGFHYKGQKYIAHSNLHHSETALYRTSAAQQLFIFSIVLALVVAFVINWHAATIVLVAVITVVYFLDLLFNLFLIYRSFSKSKEIQITQADLAKVSDQGWPMYTIFCPLYKEHEVIPQFVSAMNKLEYPKDKLQIMLLLEENDTQTIEAAKNFNLPSTFEIVVVPHSLPKTKPKACNYGLLHAKGDFVVIYDAEDIPDPDQLKKAVLAFNKVPPNVVCIQAKLNFYNPHQNLLTRAFTAEYSLWFDLILTGLQSIDAPIPLGGTSNHFKTLKLRELRGWDAFNVTEDCDLGMRLVKKRYRTAVLNSTTLEEANSELKNWFRQRSRWVKGYIQSYFVHMRHPKEFIQRWHEPHVITFQLIVGGKILSMFINPLMWVITLTYFTMRTKYGEVIESFFPTSVFYMALCSLVFGNFLYLYYYMIGCAKRGHDDLIKYAILIPFYWLMMSMAAWIALYEFIVKPHYWQKTKHGLHIKNVKASNQAVEKIGRTLVDQSIYNS